MRERIFALVVVVLVLVALGSGQSSADPDSSTALQFSAKTLDGADFSGQSLAGKPAVLWFWAPWCSTCQAEAPGVARAAQTHPQVTFLGVPALDQLPAMQQFVATYNLGGFTHLDDSDGSVWLHFGVTEQPAYAFIAADGRVEVVKGTLSEEDLDQRLTVLATI